MVYNQESKLVEVIDVSNPKDFTNPKDPKVMKIRNYMLRGYSFLTNDGVLKVYETKQTGAE